MRKLFILGAAFSLLIALGCTQQPKDSPQAANQQSSEDRKVSSGKDAKAIKADDEHGHKPSAHGGILVPIGRDNYHAEAVFEKGGILRLYMLGQDESKVLEIAAQPLSGFVKAEGDTESVSFLLRPEPQPGDTKGLTSLFMGHLPKELIGKKLEVTIPAIKIGNDRFRIAFKSTADAEAHGMPSKVADEAEKKLYLTPGGLYTEADIKANGNVTASQKFKGNKAEHDLKPQVGDKICPITLTKANPKFSWIIGGKKYEFCCPPCVDEFVAVAKENPSEIKDPSTYVKK
jgi:YHS domain-containing protein